MEIMDPYYLGQKEVASSITDLRAKLNDREDMLNDPRGGNHEIFRAIGMKMTDSLAMVRGLLRDLSASISQVRANPEQFRISASEIANREQFIRESLQELQDIENQMNVQSSNQRNLFHASPFQPVAPVAASNDSRPPPQTQLLAHQEEQIELIGDQVKMQKQMGLQIINAMKEDHERLVDLEQGIDLANSQMKTLTNQIVQLIENEGKIPTYLVAILSVVLILMLFWVA